jgi:hypothetical protein
MHQNNLIPLYTQKDIERLTEGLQGFCRADGVMNFINANEAIAARNQEILKTNLTKEFYETI